MRTEFLCISVLRAASEPRVKLTGCKSALTAPSLPPPPPPIHPHPPTPPPPPSPRWFTLLTVLTLCCFLVCSTRRFVLSLALCYFVFLCFLVFCSSFSIAITSLGEERANLSAFRTFVRFALVWFCLFPLPLGVWEGLRLVIVALP